LQHGASVARSWLDLDDWRLSCHSWQRFAVRRLSAMTTLLILLALLTLTVWLATRLRDWLRQDGLGHRPPPRSHHDWTEDTDHYLS